MAHRAFSEILLHITWHTERNALLLLVRNVKQQIGMYKNPMNSRPASTPAGIKKKAVETA